jgi:hypothetical protein
MRFRTDPLTPMEDAQFEHAWADHSQRFPMDQLIRGRDYEVTDRPNVGPVMWRLKSANRLRVVKFTQAEVIELEKLA